MTSNALHIFFKKFKREHVAAMGSAVDRGGASWSEGQHRYCVGFGGKAATHHHTLPSERALGARTFVDY